jgi:hypothetical protein
MANGAGKFGSCCENLKDAMAGDEFEPLISVDDDGVLYMSVGLLEADEDEPNMIDHPIFFCPFCGTKLQSPEDVDAKTGGGDA